MPNINGFFPSYDPEDPLGSSGLQSNDKDNHMAWGWIQKPVDNDRGSGVEVNLSNKLAQAVIHNRNYYRQLAFARYHELILNIRDYANVPVSFNKLRCEYYLRNGDHVAVGKDKLGNFVLLGVVNDTNTITNPATPYATGGLNGHAIKFIIPQANVPVDLDNYREITQSDNAKSGDFVVLRNKPYEYVNDFAIVCFYCDRLAELMASRASLIMQAKITTVIPVANGNSEDADQIAESLYNGTPFLLMNENRMRLKQLVTQLGDSSVPERIKTLKQAFNDEQNELNNMLGINSTGIDKASGVSDKEVDSNNDYVVSTTNMYIRGVQEGLSLYNARFNTNYYCFLNQPSMQALDIGGENDGSDNDNN